MLLKSNF